MRRIKMAPINPVGPKVKYDKDYVRPNVPQQKLTEEIIRIYPPQAVGAPAEVEVFKCTPMAKRIMLERSHYSDGGVYIDMHEKSAYFESKQEIKYVDPTPLENVPEFDHLTDTEYAELKESIMEYLAEKNFSTKGILKGLTIEQMVDRYKIPIELLKTAIL